MTTHDDGRLDDQIRELLGRAVADTPEPPELDNPMLLKAAPNNRNPWMIGGGLGLGAAAALAAILIIPGLGDENTIQTPATQVPTVSTIDPVTTSTLPNAQTTLPAVDPSASSPATSVVTPAVEPVVPGDPLVAPAGTVVLAGADGIKMKVNLDGGFPLVSDIPASSAMLGPDGDMWFNPIGERFPQRAEFSQTSDDGWLINATTIELPVQDNHVAVLRDVATVQGELTLLYESRIEPCDGQFNPAACISELRTFSTETGAMTVLAERTTWEGNWGGVQLADSGLIVGSSSAGVSTDLEIFNVGTLATPAAGELGIESSYSECNECPDNYTIDQSGSHIAWTEGAAGDTRIVIHTLATGERIEVPIPLPESVYKSDLQISNITVSDGRVERGRAVLLTHDFEADPNFDQVGNPLVVDLATGVAAGADPNMYPTIGSAAAVAPDPAGPSDPVAAPPAPALDDGTIVAAGPDGISIGSAVDGSDFVELTSDAADTAMVGPDGTVWFNVANERFPRVLDPATGDITTFELSAPPGQRVLVQDVATVQGELTVLYVTEPETCISLMDDACRTELRTFRPATGANSIVAEQSAWENGWSRLQLADNGLIVGSSQALVVTGMDIYNVSTGVTPTVASLGLEPNYDECGACPHEYTVNRAGTHVAWIDASRNDNFDVVDRRIVIVELQTGARDEVALDFDGNWTLGGLQISSITMDAGAVVSGQAVFGAFNLEGSPSGPQVVDLSTGATATLPVGQRATIS